MSTKQESFSEALKPFLANTWPIMAIIVMSAVVYIETLLSMIDIWINNETYSHGFIIVPISLWLLWQQRAEIALTRAKAEYRLYPLLLMTVVVWMLAELLGIQALSQFAAVSSMITAIWLIAGFSLSRLSFFPIAFLIFLVPIGEFLVPPMMEFTATFTVGMLRLTGIPVFREGMFFTIPSGNWSVVEACSGVRYIIASVVLGVLFAFLNYRSLKKQLLLIIASLLIPVLANGLRAYIIVIIGHMSNMELATGVDHLIYGWVFFGVVMLVLFAVGSIWRDDMSPPEVPAGNEIGTFPDTSKTLAALAVVALTFVLSVAYVNNQRLAVISSDQLFVSGLQGGGWAGCETLTGNDWRPGMYGASALTAEKYCREKHKVSLFIAHYPYQQQGFEAVNYANRLNPKEGDDFTATKVQSAEVLQKSINGELMPVETAMLTRQGRKYRVWRWYRMGTRIAADGIKAKFAEAYAKLIEGRGDAMMIVLATEIGSTADVDAADELLSDYTGHIIPMVYLHADNLVNQ